MQAAYSLAPSDRVLQKTTYCFDVSVWEFFWPLLAGAALVVARPGAQADAAYLREVLGRERVSVLHFVPSMLSAFLDSGLDSEEGAEAAGGGSLRRVVCSGEALSREQEARFNARYPGVGLSNLYGPTEASIDVSFWDCDAEGADGGGAKGAGVPIGRAVWNTQLYVLDARGEVVPVGVSGELHIGGVGLARGYLNRPALTAEKFIPDTMSGEAGARLYRTGDLARYRADGAIEYLGRIDHQVKVRGFRIELGEIEAALRGHEQVREAVVIAREDEPGHKRLVAYVVSRSEGAEAGGELFGELRTHLRGRLPEYMVPSYFVALGELPLSANGKLDRKALPAPDRQGDAESYVAPRTPVEEALCSIWQQVLGVERVGVKDNFFDLGGHSLLLMRVASRVREEFHVDIPLRRLFETPTIDAMTLVIAAEQAEQREGVDVAQTLQAIKQLSPAEVKALLESLKNKSRAVGP
jgi:acyl-coenzyme A synthetase/AMP-(fatty) acid ligase/aryl carrier-like protein